MIRTRKPSRKSWIDWLDANKERRDRLMGFGISCCVHLALVVVLSLIAIGTGSIEVQSLLVASANEVEEEMIFDPGQ